MAAGIPAVVGCLTDARARSHVATALRDHATVTWFDSFADLRHAVESMEQPATVVVGLADAAGSTAVAFAREIRESTPGTAIVACCGVTGNAGVPLAALADVGVHDILFVGAGDEHFATRTLILGAAVGAAADLTMRTLRDLVPEALVGFVAAAVRRPRQLQRVGAVADALMIPRQTLARWCREHRYVGPEELLVWARLFLVATLLETTEWTVETIARQLEYGSPSALRNRIRVYTGTTAMEIRSGGIDVVMRAFLERVSEMRAVPLVANVPSLPRVESTEVALHA